MLREKIKNGEKTVGMYINLCDTAVARIAGLAGFDFVWIDLEHGHMSLEQVLNHIIAIKAGGTDVLVRVGVDDPATTKRVIELGVDGVVFPMVTTAEQADARMRETLYPPYGTRGFGPTHAVRYGYDSAADYVKDTENNLLRFIQVEHKDAVDNLPEIVKNPYIDGYLFGPNDLSGSIGELLNVFGENTSALLSRAMKILREHGKYTGVLTGDPSPETIAHWHELGVDMISAGADYVLLQQAMVHTREVLTLKHKNK